MQNKHISAIIFTAAFALSVAITVSAGLVDRRINSNNAAESNVDGLQNTMNTSDDKSSDNNLSDRADTTASHNTHVDIFDQILSQFASHETVFSADSVGGSNSNRGGTKYVLDGETVTTIYETETTTIEGETIIDRDETTVEETTVPKDTEKPPVTIAPVETTSTPVTFPVTEPATDTIPETTETTTHETETDGESTDETNIGEDTTGSDNVTDPVDNSQAEVIE